MEKRKTTVVNLYGGPGAGKSVLAARLFAEMKVSNRFGSVEQVQEYAKILVWQGRLDLLENQIHVTKGQLSMLMPLVGKVNYIVTDSPIHAGLIYSPQKYFQTVEEMIEKASSSFDSVNIFLDRGSIPFEKGGRVHTLEESKKIDKKILEMLEARDMPYIKISSTMDAASVLAHIEKTETLRTMMFGAYIEPQRIEKEEPRKKKAPFR